MKINFKPASPLEKFAFRIYNLLVENFSKTFFVGGMVRDMLLGKKIVDIDITTIATPAQVVKILQQEGLKYTEVARNFGVISAIEGDSEIEIASFREDRYIKNRYPKIRLVEAIRKDSKRRDFTINSLYLSLKSDEVLDFNNGLEDLKQKFIKFIGKAKQKILEDPLRILRAFRFALDLQFKIEKNSFAAIKQNIHLLSTLTSSRTEKEIKKSRGIATQKILKNILDKPELVDKYFI